MSKLVALLAGVVFLVVTTGPASAASPTYCALYAREYANQIVEVGAVAAMTVNVEEQAFNRCLNQDEDPPLPTASAYFGTKVDDPSQPLAQGDASEGDEVPVTSGVSLTSKTDREPAVRKVTASAGRSDINTSGHMAWTPEWEAWCKRRFPNSFNPETGMVKPYKTNKWRMCE